MDKTSFLTAWFGSEPSFLYVVGSTMCSSAFFMERVGIRHILLPLLSKGLVLRSWLESNCVRVLISDLRRGWILQCVSGWLSTGFF